MTTTDTYVGMESVAKPTSRVLAPPGGKANFTLSGYEEDPPAPAMRKKSTEEVESEKLQAEKQAAQDMYQPSPPQPIRPAEDSYANLFGEGDPSKSDNRHRGRRRYPDPNDLGHNPVTGEDNPGAPETVSDPEPSQGAGGKRAKPAKLDPASMPAAGGRVENKTPMKRQPPGGKDSGIFG